LTGWRKYKRDKHPWSQEFAEDHIDTLMARNLWGRMNKQEKAIVRRTKRDLGIPDLGELGIVELMMKISLLEADIK